MRLKTAPFKFDRNSGVYTPIEADQFLRWKMKRPRWQDKVKTTEDFVNLICSGSVTTGKPYVALLPDGSKHNIQTLFSNELALLKEFQERQTPPQEPAPAAASTS